MSETDTYYQYRSDRVLIETSRMYRPSFSPATVYLTGAQVEMLRNMMQYLNRPNTYVEEYEVDKYKTPSAAQFDGIQEIVADLEEKLMGNPNTIWGYDDRVFEDLSESSPNTGTWVKLSTAVPAGEVHTLEFCYIINDSRAGTGCTMAIVGSGVTNYFLYDPINIRYFPNTFVGKLTLKEGDHIRLTMSGVVTGDAMKACFWGSKMVVP